MANVIAQVRIGAVALFLAAVLPAGYLGQQWLTGNFHEVEAGTLFRSGQLGPDALRAFVAAKGIRTILNLRGDNPGSSWFVDEARVARDMNVQLTSIGISARSMPSMETMVRIADVLRNAPQPILVHCEGGADRSGLAAGIFEIAVRDRRLEDAERQLSVSYGHFPWLGSPTVAMDRALALFASYWTSRAAGRFGDGLVAGVDP